MEECRRVRTSGAGPVTLLTRAAHVTEANASLFDAANGFAGCIPGIHHVLQRQGLLASNRCLDPKEVISPGQAEAIECVCKDLPRMTGDEFVEANLDDWLAA